MIRRWVIIIGIIVPVGVVIGFTIAPRVFNGSGSAAEWLDYFTAEDLMKNSDRIVIAQHLDDTPHVIPVISSTGEQIGSITEIYRRFEVVESLLGDAQEGETTHIVMTASNTRRWGNGKVLSESYDVMSLSQDLNYILFLVKLPRQSQYPTQYGDIVWTITGEPGIAQLDADGSLKFKSSERYKEENGTSSSDSAAPFSLTKEQLKAFVESLQ